MKTLHLLLNVWFISSYTKGLNQRMNVTQTHIGILEGILKKYDHHVLIFHCDDMSKYDIFIRPMINFVKQSYLNSCKYNNNYRRPPENRILNIYLTDPSSHADNAYGFRAYDVNIFVIHNFSESYFNLWNGNIFREAAALFVIDTVNDKLYTYPRHFGIPQKLREINVDDGIPDLRIFHNDFNKFNGFEFSIYYFNHLPYFWCTNTGKNECVPGGFESMILRTMSQMMNFTYKLIDYQNGRKYDGSAMLQSMVEETARGDVDWASGGLVATPERSVIADIPMYFSGIWFEILFASIDENSFWTNVKGLLLVTDWIVAVLIIISIIVISVISKLASSDNITFTGYFMSALKSLVEQSDPQTPGVRHSSVKIMFLTWWLVGLCLTSVFRSEQASFLIASKIRESESIEELLAEGYRFEVFSTVSHMFKQTISVLGDPRDTKIMKRLDVTEDYCATIRMTLQRKIAYADVDKPLRYKVLKYCTETFPGQFSRLRLLKIIPYPAGGNTWMMRKSTPFLEQFQVLIARLHATGHISHWIQSGFVRTIPRSNQERSQVPIRAISLVQIAPSFGIYGVGILLSFIAFLCERIKFTDRSTRNRKFFHHFHNAASGIAL